MKKKISIALETVLLCSCLPLNVNVSAFGHPKWHDICKAESVNANAVIVDIDKTNPENTRYFFYIDKNNEFTCVSAERLKPYLENSNTLTVGDLLRMENVCILETYPGQLGFEYNAAIEYCGNGIEMLGRDFEKSLLSQVCEEKEFYNSMLEEVGYTIVRGDATEDENVDILDVITVNKTILGKQELNGYAKYVSDINRNSKVDPSDSLEIMKYVVGLTDTLGAEA